MMEYRVIYYTESYGDGVGSPRDPWIGYSGRDFTEARETFYSVRSDFGESDGWTVRLQTREVTEWNTVLGMKRDGAAR